MRAGSLVTGHDRIHFCWVTRKSLDDGPMVRLGFDTALADLCTLVWEFGSPSQSLIEVFFIRKCSHNTRAEDFGGNVEALGSDYSSV
ncbi:hypothetical protein M413DRAFT_445125 [Hebeloma cylindrosporum]|uniref:Uncharacterized protein n=1 Tax=Hebeloma cylindrosporum TaxID=76867 RepID=A0A0C3CCD9_HEBCY|nr:hypothetical protein M413DRAFT_445125 [Hebeloma cylindrosporum h7]